jgi:hypothetical protein
MHLSCLPRVPHTPPNTFHLIRSPENLMRGTDHKAPIRSYIYMFINAVANGVMLWLCLWYDFYNIVFKIKRKLRVASRSVLIQNKNFCVRAWSLCFRSFEMDETWNILGPKTKKHQSLHVYLSFFWSGSCASFQMKTKRHNPFKHRGSLTQRHVYRAQKTQTKYELNTLWIHLSNDEIIFVK